MISPLYVELHPPQLVFSYHVFSLAMVVALLVVAATWRAFQSSFQLWIARSAIVLSVVQIGLGAIAAGQLSPFIREYKYAIQQFGSKVLRDWDFMTSPLYWVAYAALPVLSFIVSIRAIRSSSNRSRLGTS
jgi:hypothetical protein